MVKLTGIAVARTDEATPSIVTCHVPCPAPAETVSVPEVVVGADHDTKETAVVPVKLLVITTVLPPVHAVPMPTKVRATLLDPGTMLDGATV